MWQTPSGATTRQAVAAALDAGYRHIDTARIYGNEADVGAAVRDERRRARGGVRHDEAVERRSGLRSARCARSTPAWSGSGLDYVDLYLIHWPVAGKRLDSWRALERIHADGRARSIGVSNFLVPHLEELLGKATRVPAVNQIELTPFLQRRETRALCAQHGIVVEAYSPLTHGKRLDHPVVEGRRAAGGTSVAQVLLRWGLQHGLVVLPKSTKPARIAENGALFDFTLDDRAMTELDALEEGLVTGWDPAEQP